SEEGCKFQCDTRCKLARSRLLVQTNELEFRVRKVFRKGAAAGDESAYAIWMQKLDRLDMDLETVTRLRTFDVNGFRQGMRTWAKILDRAFDIFERLRNLIVFDPGKPKPLNPARKHRFDTHGVS